VIRFLRTPEPEGWGSDILSASNDRANRVATTGKKTPGSGDLTKGSDVHKFKQI
jgi:hypothetical protein